MYALLGASTWLFVIGVFGIVLSVIGWLWPEQLHPEATFDTPAGELPTGGSSVHTVGWWGMSCTIATEAAFFAYLLFSYFYLASNSTNAWPSGGLPKLGLVGVNTIILISSSVVLEWGRRGIRSERLARVRAGLGLTMVLGIVFLALQAVEYHRKTFSFSTDAYSSLFYTITGFHGAHVAVGVLMLGVVLARTFWRTPSARRHEWLTNASMYWHFVDLVWLAVFTSLYLTPRLV